MKCINSSCCCCCYSWLFLLLSLLVVSGLLVVLSGTTTAYGLYSSFLCSNTGPDAFACVALGVCTDEAICESRGLGRRIHNLVRELRENAVFALEDYGTVGTLLELYRDLEQYDSTMVESREFYQRMQEFERLSRRLMQDTRALVEQTQQMLALEFPESVEELQESLRRLELLDGEAVYSSSGVTAAQHNNEIVVKELRRCDAQLSSALDRPHQLLSTLETSYQEISEELFVYNTLLTELRSGSKQELKYTKTRLLQLEHGPVLSGIEKGAVLSGITACATGGAVIGSLLFGPVVGTVLGAGTSMLTCSGVAYDYYRKESLSQAFQGEYLRAISEELPAFRQEVELWQRNLQEFRKELTDGWNQVSELRARFTLHVKQRIQRITRLVVSDDEYSDEQEQRESDSNTIVNRLRFHLDSSILYSVQEELSDLRDTSLRYSMEIMRGVRTLFLSSSNNAS